MDRSRGIERTYLAKKIGKVKGLKQGVQIACSTLVLQADISCLFLGVIVDKVMPEHTSLIFDEADVGGNVCGFVLAQRSVAVLPWNIEHFSALDKAGKAPVAFLLSESMVSGMVDV